MTAKKVKDGEILENTPVEETTESTEVTNEPVENETPAENHADDLEGQATEEQETSPVEETKKEKEARHVSIKEVAYKHFDTIKAPAEIKKIIEFYGITSRDIFDGNIEKMGLKKDEIKALKEWYATLI